MNIIVVGAGKVGRQIIGELSDSCDIVLIEISEKIIEDITSEYDIQSILGNAVNVDVLKEAGAANADIFISVTGSDELNIISSMIANKLGAKSTVARVRSPEYTKSAKFLSSSLNITKLINPDEEAAVQILEIIKYPLAKSIEHFANKKLQMVEFKIPNGSYLDGIDLKSFRKTLGYNMIVCIVERGEEVIIPKGDTTLRSNDNIYVTGSKKDMDKFYDSINVKTKKIEKVMLIGASKICFFLTELLLNEKKDVKILEVDRSIAEEIAIKYPEATVINKDGTNQNYLIEEGITSYDCVVSLTGIDEENIILSLYSSYLGVNKSIAKVNRINMIKLIENKGLDTAVVPKGIIANQIVRFVRSKMDSGNSTIENLYKLSNRRIEAIEFVIKEKADYTDIKLKDLSMKENTLIAFIYRKNHIIFPTGEDVLKMGDRVVIITSFEDVTRISDLFI